MPRPGLQLALLLLAVPAQYIISKWMTPQAADREYLTRSFFADGVNMFWKICNLTEWKIYVSGLKERILYATDQGECPAKEVMHFAEPNGYFSGSPEPRKHRDKVKYRIGQVIKHKRFGYRGVIVGWDYRTKAPDQWIQVNHFDPTWRYQPNYSILVDTRDRTDVQTTYVVEENMEVISDTKIEHPDIDEYFQSYGGSQYVPRPWLKELYPLD
ncbi:F-box only protein 21-like [Hydractinia symbiolongicarpus]|uniref:F-box only protein 21-like n=1 Tax=Hydractinia symbiolongicarpus TaxID=13093 RepID=UPI00255168C7|nr:F-box only protein 21-like [Hydractinia symbiolongicarpus]